MLERRKATLAARAALLAEHLPEGVLEEYAELPEAPVYAAAALRGVLELAGGRPPEEVDTWAKVRRA